MNGQHHMNRSRFKSMSLSILEKALRSWYDDPDNIGSEPFIYIRVYKKVKRDELMNIRRTRALEMLTKQFEQSELGVEIKKHTEVNIKSEKKEKEEKKEKKKTHNIKVTSRKIKLTKTNKTIIRAKSGIESSDHKMDTNILSEEVVDDTIIETEYDGLSVKVENIKDEPSIIKVYDSENKWFNLSWVAGKMKWARDSEIDSLKKEYAEALMSQGINVDDLDDCHNVNLLSKYGAMTKEEKGTMSDTPMSHTPVILPSVIYDGSVKKHLIYYKKTDRSNGQRFVSDIQYVSIGQFNKEMMEFANDSTIVFEGGKIVIK